MLKFKQCRGTTFGKVSLRKKPIQVSTDLLEAMGTRPSSVLHVIFDGHFGGMWLVGDRRLFKIVCRSLTA